MYQNTFKMKRISIVLIICLLFGMIPTSRMVVHANTEDETIVYQDGIQYEISLDDDMNLIVYVNDERGDCAYSEIDKNGNFIFEREGEELFVGEINELSFEEVDVEVKDAEGDIIETYEDISDLDCSDSYEGQASFTLTTGVVITFAQVLSALINAGIVIVVASVAFITGTKFREKVNGLSATDQSKAKSLYYKAEIRDEQDLGSNVFINPKGIKKSAAASYIKASRENSVYSFTAKMAKGVIEAAGYVASGTENHYDSVKARGVWYYDHYHPNGMSKPKPHSFYGTPKPRKNFGGNIG